MPPRLIDAEAVAPQPWRNGGGQTRELIAWPAQGPWQLRISRADIDADGPFSAFAGITRWFAVLQGAGVSLQFEQQHSALGAGDEAIRFDGGQAPDCRLLDGPTLDLNLMARAGESCMCKALAATPWQSAWRMRGLYTCAAGQWQGPDGVLALPAHTLLWDDAAEPCVWTFTPESADSCRALWLGFTPND